MKEKLAIILGRKIDTDDDVLLEVVRQMRFELEAKMGYASASLIEKLKRDGLFRRNAMTLSWECRLSDMEMDKITKSAFL